jgi:hypothetical protein
MLQLPVKICADYTTADLNAIRPDVIAGTLKTGENYAQVLAFKR